MYSDHKKAKKLVKHFTKYHETLIIYLIYVNISVFYSINVKQWQNIYRIYAYIWDKCICTDKHHLSILNRVSIFLHFIFCSRLTDQRTNIYRIDDLHRKKTSILISSWENPSKPNGRTEISDYRVSSQSHIMLLEHSIPLPYFDFL